MIDWDDAQPNARYWALKLIIDNFRPGDKLVETSSDSGYVTAQAFVNPQAGTKAAADQQTRAGVRAGVCPAPEERRSRSSTWRPARTRRSRADRGHKHQAGWIRSRRRDNC